MTAHAPASGLAALRRFARARPTVERCGMCAAELAEAHEHLVERKTGQARCACATCARLLAMTSASWVLVRQRVERLDELRLDDDTWHALALPIDLAFFVVSGEDGRVVARYPGAGGTIESALELPAWQALAAANPALARLAPDVEALLVNRAGGRRDSYVVSIDECYRLAGLIRLHWRGFGGGPDVWRAIDTFFGELEERSRRS